MGDGGNESVRMGSKASLKMWTFLTLTLARWQGILGVWAGRTYKALTVPESLVPPRLDKSSCGWGKQEEKEAEPGSEQ